MPLWTKINWSRHTKGSPQWRIYFWVPPNLKTPLLWSSTFPAFDLMFPATILNVITIIQITYNIFEWKLYASVFYLIKLQPKVAYFFIILSSPIYLSICLTEVGCVSGTRSLLCDEAEQWWLLSVLCWMKKRVEEPFVSIRQ